MKSSRWLVAKVSDVPEIQVRLLANGLEILIPDRSVGTDVFCAVVAAKLLQISANPPKGSRSIAQCIELFGVSADDMERFEHEEVASHNLSRHGSKYWTELHLFSIRRPPALLAYQWFDHWKNSLPFGECPCKEHFDKYIQQNPPDFESLFQWGVDFHNAVNRRICKPQVTIEEAVELWTSRVL